METVTERPKVSAMSLPSGKLVELYIELRDRRAKLKAAFDNDDAADKAKQEKIEGILLQRFHAEGITSQGAPSGTAFIDTRVSASVVDRESFYSFCVERGEEALMDIRANKPNIDTFVTNNGDLPPGINWSQTQIIKVRRS